MSDVNTISNVGECPQDILNKACEKYQAEFDANDAERFLTPDMMIKQQMINGWNWAKETVLSDMGSTDMPPEDIIKETAGQQPLPLLPMSSEDRVAFFKQGVEACLKVAKEKQEKKE